MCAEITHDVKTAKNIVLRWINNKRYHTHWTL